MKFTLKKIYVKSYKLMSLKSIALMNSSSLEIVFLEFIVGNGSGLFCHWFAS